MEMINVKNYIAMESFRNKMCMVVNSFDKETKLRYILMLKLKYTNESKNCLFFGNMVEKATLLIKSQVKLEGKYGEKKTFD